MTPAAPWLTRVARGEMGRRICEADWGATPLGPPDRWPAALRLAAASCLQSDFPTMIGWGPDLVQLYNDAFIPILGEKHPQLGRRIAEAWAETWDVVGPMLQGILDGGEAVFFEDALMWVDRLGFVEDTYFTFCYAPILHEEGIPGGVMVTAMETTGHVLDARRLRALGDLNVAVARGDDRRRVAAAGLAALDAHREDLPFALAYLRDDDTGELVLAARAGVDADRVPPRTAADGGPWGAAAADGVIEPLGELDVVHELSGRPVVAARVMPLGEHGLLVAGMSPARRRDAEYLRYLDLAAAALAGGLDAAATVEHERRRADELAAIDRAKTEFLQNVSHELRTPLTLIRAPVLDLLASELTPGQREAAELVERSADRLRRLVDGVLEFSRTSARASAPEPVELCAATRGLLALFAPTAERMGIALHVACEPERTPVLVDRDAWERIVLNLVSNALKYTEEGEVRVALRVADGTATLTVTDTGIGIAPEDLERIFERFARVERPGARSHEGAGIGLALVRELARRGGGDATVTSRPGAGSTFTVRIAAPASPEGAVQPTPPSDAAAALAAEVGRWEVASPAAADGDRPLVVCADDSADMRDYLSAALGGEFRIAAAADGVEALALVRAQRPALVLADVMMPRMDGLELVRELRDDDRTAAVPVVLVSARAGDEATVTGLAAGADDYIVKPFTPEELRARVRTHVELAARRARLAGAEHLRERTALAAASARRLRAALAASGTGLALGDLDAAGEAVMTEVNPALCQLLRRPRADLCGVRLRALVDAEDENVLRVAQERLRDGADEHATVELRMLRGDDEPVWVTLDLSVVREEAALQAQFVASVRDAGERRRDESRLRYLADHDALTGLLNRRRFGEELERFIGECHRTGTGGAILMLDLDGLKTVNDQLGHAAGDKLLCGIADLMRCRMRRTDVLARFGGDEFALLLPLADARTAEAIGGDLQHRIRQGSGVLLGGATIRVTASVGIATVGEGLAAGSAEAVMLEADEALYAAKRAGRDRVRVAARERDAVRPAAAGWADVVREALAEDRFELYAQPIVALHGDPRARYELLLRLHAPGGEVLEPGSFIVDAERSATVVDIDHWVIRRSARMLAAWPAERGPVTFHVNLSPRTITSPATAGLIAAELRRTGAPGSGLVYEITETAAITSLDLAQGFAAAMRDLGCGLALDDFGSGFASFTYLKHLDYDYVKIDGNLIRDVACNQRDQQIVRCVAELAREMGKHAVAECVGDDETVALLRGMGVAYAQGYHLGRPAPLALPAAAGVR